MGIDNQWQSFVQRLDADGTMVGEAVGIPMQAGISQLFPDLTVDDAGGVYLAHTDSTTDRDDRVVHTSIPAGGSSVTPVPPVVTITGAVGGDPSYGAGPVGLYLAHTLVDGSRYRVVLTPGGQFDPDDTFITLGRLDQLNYMPKVVGGPSGGAVAWYKNTSGLRNELYLQRFTDLSGSLNGVGVPVVVANDVPPYQPSLTHVSDDTYAAAWSAGTNPDFFIKLRFVELQ
jgi:hypothetical protein